MAEFTYDLDPVTLITAGAVGQPGQRVFYVQARAGKRLISLLAEKEQVGALASAVEQLLDDLSEKNPLLSTSDDLLVSNPQIEEPLEPLFRISQLGLGYDAERDAVILVAQGTADDEGEEAPTARFVASRQQMRAMAQYAARVVASGRPICGNCGQPMNPNGHFCPQRNGHGPVPVQ
jgi:uncharacterized repeat protein (TIGR03847 family)